MFRDHRLFQYSPFPWAPPPTDSAASVCALAESHPGLFWWWYFRGQKGPVATKLCQIGQKKKKKKSHLRTPSNGNCCVLVLSDCSWHCFLKLPFSLHGIVLVKPGWMRLHLKHVKLQNDLIHYSHSFIQQIIIPPLFLVMCSIFLPILINFRHILLRNILSILTWL